MAASNSASGPWMHGGSEAAVLLLLLLLAPHCRAVCLACCQYPLWDALGLAPKTKCRIPPKQFCESGNRENESGAAPHGSRL
eukprot:9495955-Pyramimonas_sp.AAC.1